MKQSMVLFVKYIWRLVLATFMSVAMYCLWADAVSPVAQRIVQLVVLFEYGLYFLSLVILFQVTPLQKWLDALLPPMIAIGFALIFWGLPDDLLAGAFLGMIFFSAIFSGTAVCFRLYQWLGALNLVVSKTKQLVIGGVVVSIVGITYLLVSAGFHGFPIYFIFFPFLIVLFYGFYCLVAFLYPVALLLFLVQKRPWRAWLGIVISTVLWLALLSQTFPLRAWWMVQFVDPCYEETIGGRSATYEKLIGTERVCMLPAGKGPFNVSTRQTLENFDSEKFVEQKEILDDGSVKIVYIPKQEYEESRKRERVEKQRLETEKRNQSGTEENRRMHIFQDAWIAEVSGYLELRTEECPSWEKCETSQVAYFVVTSTPVPEYITLTSENGFDFSNFRIGCDTGSAIRYIPEQKIRLGIYQKITGQGYQRLKNSSSEHPVKVHIDKPSRPDEFGTEGVVCMTPFDSIQVLAQ